MPFLRGQNDGTLYRVIVVLIGIIYGTIHHYNKVLIPDDLNAALTVTLLLVLLEQFFEIGHKLEKAAKAGRATEELDSYLSKDRSILGQLLKDIHSEIKNSITLRHDGYKLSQSFLAIHSYAKFWALLTEMQQKRDSALPTLSVEAIHSCTMDVWGGAHPLSARLLELQKDFHEHGGKITRILCGQGWPPDSSVRLAYMKMVEAGIEVRYYNIQRELVDHSFGWDFLHIPETRQSVIWDSFARTAGQVMTDAIYMNSENYEGKDLTKLWSDVRKYSVALTENSDANANEAS